LLPSVGYLTNSQNSFSVDDQRNAGSPYQT